MKSKFRHNKLRGRIAEKGISISRLASLCKMSDTSLYDKINGDAEFNARNIAKLCDALGIGINEIGLYFFKEDL